MPKGSAAASGGVRDLTNCTCMLCFSDVCVEFSLNYVSYAHQCCIYFIQKYCEISLQFHF